MKGGVLALDCSAAACSAALWQGETLAARRFRAMERGHAEVLMPMVEEIMAAAGARYRDLDAVAVTVGPGAFTGLRLGLAAARGIGLAAGVPVVGVGTFAAVVAGLDRSGLAEREALVLIDSKRGDFYAQAYDRRLAPRGEPVVAAPRALAALLTGAPLLVAGDGAPLARAALAELAIDIAFAPGPGLPDAADVARVVARGEAVRLPPRPLYLRRPEARLPGSAGVGAASPEGELEVALAGALDLALLAQLHGASFAPSWDAGAIASLLAVPGTFAFVARLAGEPCGLAIVREAGGEGEILTLAVSPARRRRGVARGLLHKALARLRAAGATRVLLEVERSNAAAIALYRAAGFVEVGLRPGYFERAGRPPADGLLLALQLSAAPGVGGK